MQFDNAGNHVPFEAAAAEEGRRQVTTIAVFLSLVIVAFFTLAGRCFYLQYNLADHFAEKSLIQERSYLPLEPQRGAVLDCRGRVLAASNQVRTIFAEPRIIKDPRDVSNRLASILDRGAHDICKLIVDSNNPGYVMLQADATEAQCEAAGKIHGIGIHYDWRRNYPMGCLTAHVVGFTSADNRGIEGIEYAFDSNLRGRGAMQTFLVDVHRRPLGFCLEDEKDNEMPMHGAGIILTLDATIQQFARAALFPQYKEFQAEAATAVVADPHTGAILAMVSLPDYDPTETRRTNPRFFTNRPLTDEYEPGSIIKPIVAAIALDTAVMNRYETLYCENGNYHGKGFGSIGEYRKGFGDLTLREILMVSSNIGMAKIGQRLGPNRLYEGLTLFGFGRKVGLELPGEADGMLRPPGQWTGYSVTRVPFGQEISVTGIQMLRGFCMLANGGRVVWPHIMRAMVQSDGTVMDMRPSQSRVGYIIKPEVAKWIVTQALTAVVNEREGTGTKARLDKWQVFGKTGTGQLAMPDGRGYQHDAYTASFIGGAPAADPRVVVLVSIRRPNVKLRKGYTGGTVAAPVAGAILEKTLTYLGVPPEQTGGNRPGTVASWRSAPAEDPEQMNSW
jgi:cell division protein FtsI/penicillin-binding protein 2